MSRLSESSDEDIQAPTLTSNKRGFDDAFNHAISHGSDIDEEEFEGNSHDALHKKRGFSSENSFASKRRKLSQSTSSSDEEDEREEIGFGAASFKDRLNKLMKPASEAKFENSKIQKIMDKMGHKKGEGLGKYHQGRVAPVALSTQRGRQGFGFSVEGLEAATLEWDSSLEEISVEEKVEWLEERNHISLDRNTLDSWVKEGPIKLTIEDETNFCNSEILKGVLSNKTLFDKLSPGEMRKARMRSNPFEIIRGGIFLNRAAMKMANMDAVFDFMFTSPVNESREPLVKSKELLYFADVCAGPGGFSEYVLWKKQWEAKGFGFTLKGENDFRLADFLAGPCESFETHYGVGGTDGDGDVCRPDNIKEFSEYVRSQTSCGVHFMMADGGFSVESQENIQEILSKQLYLCQFLVALHIVRTGGHFICKVFDLFTPFSVGLIYLLYKSFKKISIHKPNTSRPANSERYIIGKWKREDCDAIRDYLFSVNERYIALRKSKDIVEVVPMEILREDEDFMNYIFESNHSLGKRQVVNLVKIAAFCKDTTLLEVRQSELKTACLKYWAVPDIPRKAPSHTNPNEKIIELLGGNPAGWMTDPEKVLDEKAMKDYITSVYDWKCFVVSSTKDDPKLTFYFGLGQSKVFSLQPKGKGKLRWSPVSEIKIELSPGTLILGEILQEHQGEGRCQQRVRALHIVDAFFLGKTDLRNMHLKDRNTMCIQFAKAMNKPLRKDLAAIRVKELVRLMDIRNIFQGLKKKLMKSSSAVERLAYELESDSKYIIPSGIMFIRETKDPWVKTVREGNYAWVNVLSGRVEMAFPQDSIADLKFCFEKRLMWWWKEGLSRIDKLKLEDCESPFGLNELSDTLLTSQLRDHIHHVRRPYQLPQHRHSKGSSHSGFVRPRH